MNIKAIIFLVGALLVSLSPVSAQQIGGGGGGGGGTPGGSTGQFQYNTGSAFGGAEFWRNVAGVFWAANGVTATAICAYNTTDSNTSPTNYERGCFDWTTNSNVLTIGTVKGGTGTARDIKISSGSGTITVDANSVTTYTTGAVGVNNSSTQGMRINGTNVNIGSGSVYGSTSGAPDAAGPDTGMSRVAAKVYAFGAGPNGDTTGWFNYGGQTRVTSDQTFTSTAVLAAVTGLTVNVAAGRTYHFEAHLSWTDAAAGGVQAAIAGTATATNIIYDGWIVDSAANGIKGNAQATSLASAVASATTTGTAGFVEISGTITVANAGTLIVQAAQNTSNGTATTIKRGSTFIVQDMP